MAFGLVSCKNFAGFWMICPFSFVFICLMLICSVFFTAVCIDLICMACPDESHDSFLAPDFPAAIFRNILLSFLAGL